MTRDQIAQAMMMQQRQAVPGRPLGNPFTPAPTLQGPPPVAGNPTPPIAAPIPQHGFQTGYSTGFNATKPEKGDEESKLKMLAQMFGAG